MPSKEEKAKIKEEKKAAKDAAAKQERMKKMSMAIGLVVLVVGIIAGVNMSAPEGTEVWERGSADPSMGAEDATVVVREYSDFQCPACAAAYPVVKDILEEYGDKIRFEYNDFPLPQHTLAPTAAIGAQCAFEQDMFFEYHDELFDTQEDWSGLTQEEAESTFAGIAEDLGLDMVAFDECVTSPEIAARIDEDKAEAQELRVNQTPTFFVNDERVVGAPFSVSLRTAIDEALGITGEAAEAEAELENAETAADENVEAPVEENTSEE